MESVKDKFLVGNKRANNKYYDVLSSIIQQLIIKGADASEIRAVRGLRRKVASTVFDDPNFKRIMYLRYANDFVILIAGSSDDAHKIRN